MRRWPILAASLAFACSSDSRTRTPPGNRDAGRVVPGRDGGFVPGRDGGFIPGRDAGFIPGRDAGPRDAGMMTPGRAPQCGDTVVQAGEECDDGNRRDGDGCSQRCLDEISPRTHPALFAPTPPNGGPPNGALVSLDPTQIFQTMTDWSYADGLPWETAPDYARLVPRLDEIAEHTAQQGINRIRLEIRSGFENDENYFDRYVCTLGDVPHVDCSTVNGRTDREGWKATFYRELNDNADPQNAAAGRFHFGELDFKIELFVNRLRQRVAARGDRLWVNLTFVDFNRRDDETAPYDDNPEEYAELILATFLHMEQRYGWVPDSVQVMLEPDLTAFFDPVRDIRTGGCQHNWSPEVCGDDPNRPDSTKHWDPADLAEAIVAAGDRLRAVGFRPTFVGPSTTSMLNAPAYLDAMVLHQPRVLEYLRELSYHRYDRGNRTSADILANVTRPVVQRYRTQGYQLDTSMLEWWPASFVPNHDDNYDVATQNAYNYHDLVEELAVGGVSAAQVGGSVVWIPEPVGGGVNLLLLSDQGLDVVDNSNLTGLLTRHIRRGAVRIGATTSAGGVQPVAYVRKDGKWVVVAEVDAANTIVVGGLPAGSYTVEYAGRLRGIRAEPAQTIQAGEYLVTQLPDRGLVAIVQQ